MNSTTIDSTAVSGWSQNPSRGTPIEVAYLVLPDVEVDDHQDLADDADDDQRRATPSRGAGGLVSLDRM